MFVVRLAQQSIAFNVSVQLHDLYSCRLFTDIMGLTDDAVRAFLSLVYWRDITELSFCQNLWINAYTTTGITCIVMHVIFWVPNQLNINSSLTVGGVHPMAFFQNLVETSRKCALLYEELNVKNQIELSCCFCLLLWFQYLHVNC